METLLSYNINILIQKEFKLIIYFTNLNNKIKIQTRLMRAQMLI